MARINNWPAALNQFLRDKAQVPFDWAANNCAFWCCDWLLVAVGVDPVAKLRGRYRTARALAGLLKRRGGLAAMAAGLCRRHGWPEVPVLKAQRGDVVLVTTALGETLGVCTGREIAGPGKDGLITVPLAQGQRAWRVG